MFIYASYLIIKIGSVCLCRICLCHADHAIGDRRYFVAPCDKRKHTGYAHQQAASHASTDSAWIPLCGYRTLVLVSSALYAVVATTTNSHVQHYSDWRHKPQATIAQARLWIFHWKVSSLHSCRCSQKSGLVFIILDLENCRLCFATIGNLSTYWALVYIDLVVRCDICAAQKRSKIIFIAYRNKHFLLSWPFILRDNVTSSYVRCYGSPM